MPTLKIKSEQSLQSVGSDTLFPSLPADAVQSLFWYEKLCVSHRFDVCFSLSHLAGEYSRLNYVKSALKESL